MAFAALPHVQKIWLLDDGEFNLHPHKGGRLITREEAETAQPEPPKDEAEATTETAQPEPPKGNSKGHKK